MEHALLYSSLCLVQDTELILKVLLRKCECKFATSLFDYFTKLWCTTEEHFHFPFAFFADLGK